MACSGTALLDVYRTHCFSKVHLLTLGNLYSPEFTIGINELEQVTPVCAMLMCYRSLKDYVVLYCLAC
jgi:hypothetical protein